MSDEGVYPGCSSHDCVYGHPGGTGTNGDCRCLAESSTPHESRRVARWWRHKARAQEARIAQLEEELRRERVITAAMIAARDGEW